MGKPDAPPAPDYKSAAEATAAGNRTSQYTPYGNMVYEPNGTDSKGNDMWKATTTLAPAQQQLLDAQNQTSLGMANLQGKGLGAVQNLFGNLPSASQLPAQVINPGQTAQDAIMARMMPQLNQQRDRMENQLANQGIQIGSDAYKQSEDQFGRQINDAVSQAALQGIDVTNQARQQGMNEQGFYSQMPLNLLNALRTGSQVQNPTFGQTAQGANYLGASQMQGQSDLDKYNTDVGGYNSMMGGLMKLGGSILLGSDVDIKQDMRRIGIHERGFGIYEFRYKPEYRATWGDGTYIGVLAHEVEGVLPSAIHLHPDGYRMVDYGAL
jgi:hypothetical protein